jgi:hypothetical protein
MGKKITLIGGGICSTAAGTFSADVELDEQSDFDGDPDADTFDSDTLLLVSFPPLFREADFSEIEMDSLLCSSGECPVERSTFSSTSDPEAPGSILHLLA